MPKPLIGAIYLLNSKPDNSLAVITGFGEQMEFCQRGVADLWHLLNSSPELLKGAFVADKVVGKAAAALRVPVAGTARPPGNVSNRLMNS